MTNNMNYFNDPKFLNSTDLSEYTNDKNESPELIGTSNYFEMYKMMKLNTNQKIQTLHLNIQSLLAKFGKLKDLIKDIRVNKIIFDFILKFYVKLSLRIT